MININFSDTRLSNTYLPQVEAGTTQLQDILSIVFAIAGVIAFLVIVIAGLRFVISGGDPQKVAQSRQAILFALIGLVACSSAFIVVKFVIGGTR